MIRKFLTSVFFLIFVLISVGYAQNENLRLAVDHKVDKMKKILKLTDSQALAIQPVIKDYLTKRSEILQESAGGGIVDHVAFKSTLQALKETEYHQLAKILSDDQLKRWVDRENMMASLNPDSAESSMDDGVSLTPNGADFKF